MKPTLVAYSSHLTDLITEIQSMIPTAIVPANNAYARWFIGLGSDPGSEPAGHTRAPFSDRAGQPTTGITKQPVKDPNGTSSTKFQTERPAFSSDDLQAMLLQHNVVINAKDPNASTPLWETLLFSFGPTILLVLGFLYLSRRAASAGAGGILGGFGQSRARLYDAERPDVTFDDVAGIDEVKADLREVVDFLKEPQKYQRLGGT